MWGVTHMTANLNGQGVITPRAFKHAIKMLQSKVLIADILFFIVCCASDVSDTPQPHQLLY